MRTRTTLAAVTMLAFGALLGWLAAASGRSALAQDNTKAISQNTPGYNNKIPEKIMTPDTVETRIGTLNFFDGLPADQTVQKCYDHLDFMRAVDGRFDFGFIKTRLERMFPGENFADLTGIL